MSVSKLQSQFKQQLKQVSKNELVRMYVALYSDHILLRKNFDGLLEEVKAEAAKIEDSKIVKQEEPNV